MAAGAIILFWLVLVSVLTDISQGFVRHIAPRRRSFESEVALSASSQNGVSNKDSRSDTPKLMLPSKSFFDDDVIPTEFAEMNQWEEVRDFHFELGSKYELNEAIVNNVYKERRVYLLRMSQRMDAMQEVYNSADSLSLLAQPTRLFVEACLSLFAPKEGWPKGQMMVGELISKLRQKYQQSPDFREFLFYCEKLNSISKAELHEHKPSSRGTKKTNIKADLIDNVFLAADYVKTNFERSPLYQEELKNRIAKQGPQPVADDGQHYLGDDAIQDSGQDITINSSDDIDSVSDTDIWIPLWRQQLALSIQEKSASVADEQARWAEEERRQLEEKRRQLEVTIQKRQQRAELDLKLWIRAEEEDLQKKIVEENKSRVRKLAEEKEQQHKAQLAAKKETETRLSGKEKERIRQQKLANKKSKRSSKATSGNTIGSKGGALEEPWKLMFSEMEKRMEPYLSDSVIRRGLEALQSRRPNQGGREEFYRRKEVERSQQQEILNGLARMESFTYEGMFDLTKKLYGGIDEGISEDMAARMANVTMNRVIKVAAKEFAQIHGFSLFSDDVFANVNERLIKLLSIWSDNNPLFAIEFSRSELSCFKNDDPSVLNTTERKPSAKVVLDKLRELVKVKEFIPLAHGIGPVPGGEEGSESKIEGEDDQEVRVLFATSTIDQIRLLEIVCLMTWNSTTDVISLMTKAEGGGMKVAESLSTFFYNTLRE